MKYLLLLPLLTLLNCKDFNKITSDKNKTEDYNKNEVHPIYIYNIQGHDYLGRYQTSLIHSESCKCKLK